MEKIASDYTVTTTKSLDEAADAVVAKSKENGFGVLAIHDVQAILAKKGFTRDPYKIIEICHPRYAHRALNADLKVGLMLPCKVNVYLKGGETHISAIRPRVLSFFTSADLGTLPDEVEDLIKKIVDEAK